MAIDAKSIYDAMFGASGPLELAEKRTAIEMVGVQQSPKAEDVKMHWVHGEANLADALTKDAPGAEAVLQDWMRRKQRWTLVHDPNMRSAKKRKAERVDRLTDGSTVNFAKGGALESEGDHPPFLHWPEILA